MNSRFIMTVVIISMVLSFTTTVLAITPDIKANGSGNSITIGTDDTLSITVSLSAESSSGVNCDWWVAADTPFGWFYYDLVTPWAYAGSSYTELSTTYQGALFDLSPYDVLNMSGLPVGTYNFYFAIDTNKNGALDFDELYYDSIEVTVGTTITTPGGQISLIIPIDALPEGVTLEDIKIRDVIDDPEFSVESDGEPALAVVLLEPVGLELSKPVTLTVRQLPVEDPIRQLFVLHISGEDAGQSAELITGVESEIDPETNKLTASIPLTHFSFVTVVHVQDLVKAEITSSVSEALFGESFEATLKATRTAAPGELIKTITFTDDGSKWLFYMSDPWTLMGKARGARSVGPRTIENVPPTTSLTGQTFTSKVMFECIKGGGFSSMGYSANATFKLRKVWDSPEFGVTEEGLESKYDTYTDAVSIDCDMPKIVALAAPPFTTYTLSPGNPGGASSFLWSGQDCGSATGVSTDTMVWKHGGEGAEDCKHEGVAHPDTTITLLVTGTFPISGESYKLRCTYQSAASGEGPECTRIQ